MFTTRREFLAAASCAAGSTFAARPLWARTSGLGQRRLPPGTASAAQTFLPDSADPSALYALAQQAVDAARSAGAAYADIRLGEQASMSTYYGNGDGDAWLSSQFTYGVRVLVDGVWAFVHGDISSADAVTHAARSAVAKARGYATVSPSRIELASVGTPAVGEWTAPMEVDPFTVPLRVHMEVLGAFSASGARVPGANAFVTMNWVRELRVFASSDGARLAQRTCRMIPSVQVNASVRMSRLTLSLPALGPRTAGFEAMARPELQDLIKARAEDAVRIARIPVIPADVGRYVLVAEGPATASILGGTLAPALELDRVLGFEADAGGTSFLSPPMQILGTTPFSPLLNVTADRAAPYLSCTKWDDEGVEARAFPLIRKGQIVDYQASRDTSPAIQSWYTQGHGVATPQGCLVASAPDRPPLVRASHLVVTPTAESASLDTLCHGITRGILLTGALTFSDQQLTSAQVMFGISFLIEGGKPTRRLRDAGTLFRTTQFWKSLTAVGDASTTGDDVTQSYKGQPWQEAPLCVTAPACVFKDVDITMGGGARLT